MAGLYHHGIGHGRVSVGNLWSISSKLYALRRIDAAVLWLDDGNPSVVPQMMLYLIYFVYT